jgi:hypothetical protein
VALLSPSLTAPLYYYEPYFSGRLRPDATLRVWLSAGTYEGSIHRDAQVLDAYFARIGQPAKTMYLHQGHSFGAWREGAAEMLKHFFGDR